jgi:hypothetical protein
LCADKLSLTRQNTDLVFSFRIGRAFYEKRNFVNLQNGLA